MTESVDKLPEESRVPKFDAAKTGAQREGMSMVPYLYMPIEALRAYERVAQFGAKKYAPYNWEKGLPTSQVARSLIDHVWAYMRGEDVDYESGLPITDHIIWNAAALAYNQALGICDDRPCANGDHHPPLHEKSHQTALMMFGQEFTKAGKPLKVEDFE